MAIGSISFGGIIVRFVVALALVILSWNPSEYPGMSWSHVRRRMAGQADVDDVEA
ncbi:MAG: DUF6524 family protein [Gammaproteobacteria bacterium]